MGYVYTYTRVSLILNFYIKLRPYKYFVNIICTPKYYLPGYKNLFNSYCAPIYGLHLWNFTNVFDKSIFKSYNGAYSNS